MGDFQASLAGPGSTRDRTRDYATVGGQLIKPDLACVALSNRIGRQESELSTFSQQSRCPQEKIGTQIGAAALPSGKQVHEVLS